MRTLVGVCVIVVALAGCTSGVNAASNAQFRAKLLSELIENRSGCDALQHRLNDVAVDLPAVDAVYRSAEKNGCLKKNI